MPGSFDRDRDTRAAGESKSCLHVTCPMDLDVVFRDESLSTWARYRFKRVVRGKKTLICGVGNAAIVVGVEESMIDTGAV